MVTDIVMGVLRHSSQVTVETQRRQQTLSQESSDVQSGDCGDSKKTTDVVAGVLRCSQMTVETHREATDIVTGVLRCSQVTPKKATHVAKEGDTSLSASG